MISIALMYCSECIGLSYFRYSSFRRFYVIPSIYAFMQYLNSSLLPLSFLTLTWLKCTHFEFWPLHLVAYV